MSLPVRTANPTNKYLDVGDRDTDTADDSKLVKYIIPIKMLAGKWVVSVILIRQNVNNKIYDDNFLPVCSVASSSI